METRKMQLVGRGSFSITLPLDWVKEYKLKPSNQITITREDDGSLRLVSGIIQEEKKEVKLTIDADRCKDAELLGRLIVGAYIRGGDSIEVVSKHTISENYRKEIGDAINGLVGIGVVESTSNHVTLQSMVDASKFPLGPLLKRLYNLASSMYEDVTKALEDKNPSLAASVLQRENETDKIYWLIQRQLGAAAYDKTVLGKLGLKGTPSIILHVVTALRIKSIADYTVDIANNQLAIGKNGVNDADLQKIIQLGKMVHETFSNACEAFFKGDVILANSAVKSFYPIDNRKDELIKDLGPRIKDAEVAMHIMNIIRDLRGVARRGRSIAEITIANSAAEKSNLP